MENIPIEDMGIGRIRVELISAIGANKVLTRKLEALTDANTELEADIAQDQVYLSNERDRVRELEAKIERLSGRGIEDTKHEIADLKAEPTPADEKAVCEHEYEKAVPNPYDVTLKCKKCGDIVIGDLK